MALVRVVPFLLVASAAHATPIVTPPAGWVTDPEQAAKIAKHGDAVVEVYVPHAPGIALIVSRTSSPASPSEARRALDELYGTADRAQLLSPKAKVSNRSDRYEADKKQLVATQRLETDTTTVSSLTVAMDAAHTSSALGECVIGTADKALVDACVAALTTLDPAVETRVAFELPTAAATVETPSVPQPSMSDGSKYKMEPIKVEQPESSPDRRPIFVGAGLVVLAAIFWINRRQRDKFGKDDANG